MPHRLPRLAALLAILASLTACVTVPVGMAPLPVHANGQVLWGLVHGQCVPHQRSNAPPAPCAEVDIETGEAHGYAVMKDRVGMAQYLVMPTTMITGIEDSRLLAHGATNYFARAWEARGLMIRRLGMLPLRDNVSIAVNSPYGRTQDLLHLHLDCVAAPVRDALHAQAATIGPAWSAQPITLAGHAYRARWIDETALEASNPFVLLSHDLPVRPAEMRAWTLVLVGATAADGRPGFYLLAARADLAAGFTASGEELQDHDCTAIPRDLLRPTPPAPSPPAIHAAPAAAR